VAFQVQLVAKILMGSSCPYGRDGSNDFCEDFGNASAFDSIPGVPHSVMPGAVGGKRAVG
jgi:hypothetical protein